MPFSVLKKARFLIVDDEASNVRLLERILDLAGVQHRSSTTDSRQALKLFLQEQPDIVLLDLHMPQMDGFAVMSQIRASVPDGEYLPILALTADITMGTKQRALENGANDFLTKPFDHSEVLVRIQNLLENRFLHLELKKQNSELELVVKERTAQLEESLVNLRATQQQIVKQERLRALGMMASGIAHDFNNALTMVLGYAELMRPFFKEHAPERESKRLELLIGAAQDAAQVVMRLREFYRPAQQDEQRVSVDVNETILQALELTAPRWRNKSRAEGREIETRTDLAPLPSFLGNAPELREVLVNLIFNAIDAMPEGGALSFQTRSIDGRIKIRVSDTGIGMTDEERARCLEPFFTTKGDKGTGLGLASVYGFVQRYGGSIGIESSKGKGAAFTLMLPGSVEVELAKVAEQTVTVEPLRVLVVDDQEIIRELISEMLVADGHSVATAADGPAALQELGRGKWDLVVSDQSMPKMTGTQLAVEVEAHSRKVPFILLTGFGDEMRSQGGNPPGVKLVLSKPVTASALRHAISSVL